MKGKQYNKTYKVRPGHASLPVLTIDISYF